MKRTNWATIISNIAVVMYVIIIIFPFLWVIGMSLKTPIDVMAIPPKFIFTPTLDNYKRLLIGAEYVKEETTRTDFVEGFKNSMIVSTGATGLSLITSTLAAYALARFRWKGREEVAFSVLSYRFAPAIGTLLPMYAIYRRIGLYNTYIGLILVMQNISLPLLVWVVRSYMESIPVDLEQAAQVDGYSWIGAFRKILLPLVAPGIIATAVIAFINCWNDFNYGLLLAGRNTHTLTTKTMGMISYEQVLWGQMAAAAVVTVIPGVILTLLVQRWVVRGLTFGAVKT